MGTQSSPSIRALSLSSYQSPSADSCTREAARGHHKKRKDARAQDESRRRATTIGTLPDSVLLEIFNLYRNNYSSDSRWHVQWWLTLVHVCQIWRQIIFESPHALNLQILCTHGTSVKENLGIWPAFPIVIDYYRLKRSRSQRVWDDDNIIAALKHSDRVCSFKIPKNSQLEYIVKAMQVPFPVLTSLYISTWRDNELVLPAKFLGGSAPRLQEIILFGISYPSLPTLLSSASDLVKLDLFNIPPTSYISPETMVTSLATLPRLDTLVIGFRLATSRPDLILLPPVTRTVLPALTNFRFKGASEYLEDLVARIDGPRLNQIVITYLNQVVDFQVAQFSSFIDRSVGPEIAIYRHARFTFSFGSVAFTMYPHANHSPWDRRPATTIISCHRVDSQVSHITQVLSHLSAKLSNVVHLNLKYEPEDCQLTGADDVEWMPLFHQFSAVRTLRLSRALARHIVLALDGVEGEMVNEVLPSLDLIRAVDQPASSIAKFIAARQLSGHGVTAIDTDAEFDERVQSYVSK